MRLKKWLSGIIAAALTVGAVSVPSAASDRKYRCEWVDVRPDCDYDVTVKKVTVDGEERVVLRVSGIPEEMVNYKYDREGVWNYSSGLSYNYECRLSGFALNLDFNNGRNYFLFRFKEEGEAAECYICEAIAPVPPDENGEYCYVQDYMFGAAYAGLDDNESLKTEFTRDEKGELFVECYINTDDELINENVIKPLKESEFTTVMTSAGCGIELWSNGNGVSTGASYGFLSDGTMIKGDGKYIDCCSGEECDAERSDFLEYIGGVDSDTDLPKETVRVKVIDSLIDEDSGISVSGQFDEGVSLKVEKGEADETSAKFDITLVDKDGKAVQPTDNVEVRIPVPEGLKGEDCKVFREEADGSRTDMKAKLDKGVLVFTTDHFSVYVVSLEENGTPEESDTPEESNTPEESETSKGDETSNGNDTSKDDETSKVEETNKGDETSKNEDMSKGDETSKSDETSKDDNSPTGFVIAAVPPVFIAVIGAAAAKKRK